MARERGKAAVKSRQLHAISGADDAANPYAKALLKMEARQGIPVWLSSLSIKSKRRKSTQKITVSDRFRNRHLYAPLGAVGRPRQRSQQRSAWLVRGFLPLPRTAGAKTNLPMCLRRCESSSLGRFAERVGSWLHFAAADVPCKTAPFASFSGRTEKEGPARPERGPISSSVVKAIKKASVTQKFYEMVLTHFTK